MVFDIFPWPIKQYYRDGRLKKHEFYDGQIRIDYFENGEIESYSDFENDIYRDYYQNGQLKSVRIWKKRFRTNYLKRNEEYYKNGKHKYNQKKNAKSTKKSPAPDSWKPQIN